MASIQFDPQEELVVQRLAKVVGLPIETVHQLFKKLDKNEILQLKDLSDQDFKTRALHLINTAQKREFTKKKEGSDGLSIPSTSPSGDGGKEEAAHQRPLLRKLVIPKKEGATPTPTTTTENTEKKEIHHDRPINIAPSNTTLVKEDEKIKVSSEKLEEPRKGVVLQIQPKSTEKGTNSLPQPGSPLTSPNETSNSSRQNDGQEFQKTEILTPQQSSSEKEKKEESVIGVKRRLRIDRSGSHESSKVSPPIIIVEDPKTPASTPNTTQPSVEHKKEKDLLPSTAGEGPSPEKEVKPKRATGIKIDEEVMTGSGIEVTLGKKKLVLTPQEEQKLEEEAGHGIPKVADLSESKEPAEIPSLQKHFQKKQDISSSLFSKDNLPLLLIVAIPSIVIILVLIVAIYSLRDTEKSTQKSTGKSSPTRITSEHGLKEPKPSPEPPLVKASNFTPRWAWKCNGKFKESFENSLIFTGKNDFSFTVEVWLYMEAWEHLEQFRITTPGNTFNLGIQQKQGSLIFFFDVPSARDRHLVPSINRRLTGGWIHLVGMFDTEKRYQSCIVNGEIAVSRAIKMELPSLTAKIFVIEGETKNEQPLLIDELRISRGIRYDPSNPFQPIRTFELDKQTMLLLHLEQEEKQQVTDFADITGSRKYTFLTGEWEEVDSSSYSLAKDFYQMLEKKFLALCKEKFPPDKLAVFEQQWKESSEEEKRMILDQFWEKEMKKK